MQKDVAETRHQLLLSVLLSVPVVASLSFYFWKRRRKMGLEQDKKAIEAIEKDNRYYPPDVRQTMQQHSGHDFTAYDITILSQMLQGKTQKQVANHLQQHQIAPCAVVETYYPHYIIKLL